VIHFSKEDNKMIIDLDDFLNFKELEVKIVYKDGKKLETKIDSKNIKSIEVKVTPKEFRKAFYDKES
jgi:hypothetical protein